RSTYSTSPHASPQRPTRATVHPTAVTATAAAAAIAAIMDTDTITTTATPVHAAVAAASPFAPLTSIPVDCTFVLLDTRRPSSIQLLLPQLIHEIEWLMRKHGGGNSTAGSGSGGTATAPSISLTRDFTRKPIFITTLDLLPWLELMNGINPPLKTIGGNNTIEAQAAAATCNNNNHHQPPHPASDSAAPSPALPHRCHPFYPICAASGY